MTQPSQGEPSPTSSITAAEEPVPHSSITSAEEPIFDFIDAPTGSTRDWPPIGAYPGEPGNPDPDPAPEPGRERDETQVVELEPGWRQPPNEPLHARHEKPGEWRTHPPEHLALDHSPPAEVQPGVQDDQPTEAVPLGLRPQPWQVPVDPQAAETTVLVPPSKRRRTALWVLLALVLTLLIFGGGTLSAYLLLRGVDGGKGAPDPATAVNRFMTAVYTQQDATAAGDLVCREARDEQQLRDRVNQIKGYAGEYEAPSLRWSDPAVSGQTDERATVTVRLTLTTEDEKAAQQQLTFTVVHKTGWLVCDVSG